MASDRDAARRLVQRLFRRDIESKLASKKNEAWRLRGYAWGSAFACRMFQDNPELSEDARSLAKWAEGEFVKIGNARVTVDEAVCGYGG